MIPGPYIYYKCPKCGSYTMNESILSGNTFGSKLYSDGKRIAPMLPEFPYIIKCKRCKLFYWLKDENKIEKNKLETEDIDKAYFLSVDEYIEAINLKIYNTKEEELFLRIRLWWTFNDKNRREKDFILNQDYKDIYESNCIKLIGLLNKNEINEKITCAELYRNIGNYIECKNILETIIEEKYIWIKELLTKECEKNNKCVIELVQ